MKVILAGYPKTGTKTLKAAFEQLGYSNYDFIESYVYLGKEWNKILTEGGTKEDFVKMFKDVDTVTDLPSCFFWQEIHEAFPDSKIILTQRSSEDEWWISMKRQISKGDGIIYRILPLLSPSYYGFNVFLRKLCFVVFGSYGSDPWIGENKINELVMKMKYRRHNDYILHNAPKDKLLLFNLKDGWEPLCKFLGREVPDVPFPHMNKKGVIIEEWMTTNPLFLKMKREMIVSSSLLIALSAVFTYKLLQKFYF